MFMWRSDSERATIEEVKASAAIGLSSGATFLTLLFLLYVALHM